MPKKIYTDKHDGVELSNGTYISLESVTGYIEVTDYDEVELHRRRTLWRVREKLNNVMTDDELDELEEEMKELALVKD